MKAALVATTLAPFAVIGFILGAVVLGLAAGAYGAYQYIDRVVND
jgi:hypothetical protein